MAKTTKKSRAKSAPGKSLDGEAKGKCVLRLYVAGATERSRHAVLRAQQLCKDKLKGSFKLQVVDVYQQPILARDSQIVATPTLVREFPLPVLRLIGNLANTTGLFVGLDPGSGGKTIH
jgi:circadian clock protein KaiB